MMGRGGQSRGRPAAPDGATAARRACPAAVLGSSRAPAATPAAARSRPIADRCRPTRRPSLGTASRRAGSVTASAGAAAGSRRTPAYYSGFVALSRVMYLVVGELPEVVRPADDTDALALVDAQRLSADEALYARAARAANTVRGYRSDWREWTAWCVDQGFLELPADPAAISSYLSFLAGHGARVGTMSRRLSAIRFAHRLRDLPDPTEAARVVAVWEGIRRLHGAPPEQAAPLMPPELFAVLDACPEMRSWKTKGRQAEPDLAGLRDRVLILIGFVGALRRSELVGLDLDPVAEHP